jgi:uncharacterized protein (DUF2141 family)
MKNLRLSVTIRCLFLVLPVALLAGCANMGTISGGTQDTIPPVLLSSIPQNLATRFSEKNVELTFDEFIDIKNVNQFFIVSPPQSENPKVKVKKKTIQISFQNDLQSNTTYSLSFGNAITDINEGNILKDFRFVFSTDSYIDSLKCSGKVKNSIDNLPVSDVLVLLHTNLNDTSPIMNTPDYVARTRKDGSFELGNLKAGKYRIFALKDANSNFRFDQLSESFAFLDSVFTVNAMYVVKIDSSEIDSFGNKVIKKVTNSHYFPEKVSLSLFTEDFPTLKLKSAERPELQLIRLIFNKYIDSTPIFTFPDFNSQNPIYQIEKSKSGDSLNIWLNDSNIWRSDSLRIFLSYNSTFPDDSVKIVTDTLVLSFRETASKKSNRNVQKITPFPLPGGSLSEGVQPYVLFKYPIFEVRSNEVQLFELIDSTLQPVNFEMKLDSGLRRLTISGKFVSGKNYKLKATPDAFPNPFGIPTDSLSYDFKIQKAVPTGNLKISLTGKPVKGFLSLTNDNGVEVRRFYMKNNLELTFHEILPAKYKLKLISDVNGNGRWDTGNYQRHIQPEAVFTYPEVIEVRANWDIELNWNYSDNN